MKKIRIQVQGRVQGVGFRYTTKLLADRMGIQGSVKNESDGSVNLRRKIDFSMNFLLYIEIVGLF